MIRFITDINEKKAITRAILEALPEWFEVEESREQYIRECVDWPYWAACEEDKPVGFLCLKQTGDATLELAVNLCKEGKIEGFCFAPFNKNGMKLAGCKYESEHHVMAHLFGVQDQPFGEINVAAGMW